MDIKIKKITLESIEELPNVIYEIIKEAEKCAVEEKKKENEIPRYIHYYMKNMSKRSHIKIKNLYKMIDNLFDVNPTIAYSIILKEVAIELDKKYDDHISKSNHIYGISTVNGNIFEIDKSSIVNFNGFSAFRSVDDARLAIEIMHDILLEYLNGEQEN